MRIVVTVMGCPWWTAGNSVTSCSSLNASGSLLPSLTVFEREEEKKDFARNFTLNLAKLKHHRRRGYQLNEKKIYR